MPTLLKARERLCIEMRKQVEELKELEATLARCVVKIEGVAAAYDLLV